MKTATKIKVLDGFRGEAALFRVSPPMKLNSPVGELTTCDYVAVSAARAPLSGPETYIFAADEHGEIIDWCELPGSFRGALDLTKALDNAGYVVE